MGYNVEKTEFHRYDTPTGQLIRKFLDGEYNVNQMAIEAIMAADKYSQLDWFKQLTKEKDVLILDRYLLSQLIYAKANGVNVHWIADMLVNMPQPDFHFYLDISPEESMKRKGEHGDNDKYESDHKLLTEVRDGYLEFFLGDSHSMILDATEPEALLHEQILEKTIEILENNTEVKR